MFPIRDDNPQIFTPFVTYTLICVNVFVWFFVQGFGSNPALASSICTLGLIPGEILQTIPVGTRFPTGPGTLCVLGNTSSWHTVLTSMFLHGGWFHLIGNMWFLWIFGGNVEDAMGPRRFVFFYLLCGLVASATQILFNPMSSIPMVGASGAIGGVMGAYILLYPRIHVHMVVFLGFFVTTFAVPAVLMLGYWLLVQLFSGIATTGVESGGVAFWAHVGGFMAGAFLILFFRDKKLLAMHPYYGWYQKRAPTKNWRRIK
tara:strand:+ start:5344 stop:6120 length:777 start_codon:yes stop_codon:yes gene_type:complete